MTTTLADILIPTQTISFTDVETIVARNLNEHELAKVRFEHNDWFFCKENGWNLYSPTNEVGTYNLYRFGVSSHPKSIFSDNSVIKRLLIKSTDEKKINDVVAQILHIMSC